ncbi:hypothetical protein QBC39DRAFT_359346 [Podospora conica]|nr:hypothetical protein QBC39DRAFT_359346 [Schizothecium conicum]
MADDPLEAGLFGMALSDSESSDADICKDTPHTTTRADRTALSEEAFQTLKSTYIPKLENGEIWTTISLPVSVSVNKPEAQELAHAVEELYFLRRWDEAVDFIQRVMAPGTGEGEARLDEGTKRLLRHYESRCKERLAGKNITQGLAAGSGTK